MLWVHEGPFRIGLCALFLAGAASGQERSSLDAGVVIRSTTSLVQVRVVARDSKGNPVTDLQRGEFHVLDNRKAQPITLFSVDRGGPTAVDNASGPSPASAIEPAGYAMIVLDWLNTKYSDRVQAKDLVIRLLMSFQPRQRVALFLLAHESRLVCDFTSDTAELLEAVEAAGLEPADMGDDTPGRFDARFGGLTGRRNSVEEQLYFLNNRIVDTLHSFEAVAANLAHVPGRKSLIWLSAGFPVTVGSNVIPGAKPGELVFTQEVEKLFQRLNRADIAVYSVDARGLPAKPGGYAPTLQEFAERTGGTAFINRNDLDEGMRLALEDMRISYILGFHVPEGAAPGLHEIRVRVDRSGVRLRHRESYQLAVSR